MTINWIHLDFKGLMPGEDRILAWLDFFAKRGLNGVVLEYEDRIPWKSWPGTFRPGLTVAQWQHIIAHARSRGMQVVPLIQTHGHLEWLLKHPQWSAWRENGCWNELCPQHADVLPAVTAWIDEVIAIHGKLDYLHIAGDETWNLATCPRCRAIADASPDGKLHVYLSHLQRVVDIVTARGIRPLIWADAFWREKRLDLVKRLPAQVILCDWQYTGEGPWSTTTELGQAGHTVLGCSAARCSFDLSQCIDAHQPRVRNVRAWRHHPGAAGTIHTFWSRTRSLLPAYGPWEGWLPGLLAAAEPDAWTHHPLEPWAQRLDAALASADMAPTTKLADELDQQHFDEHMTDACRQWWILALRWRVILHITTANARTYAAMQTLHASIGVDPDYVNHRRAAHQRMVDQTREWTAKVQSFLTLHDYLDPDEFVASRAELIHTLMKNDWAAAIIPPATPRTAR